MITHINIGVHASKKRWWEFIDAAKLARTLRSINLECYFYNKVGGLQI
jgi:hypothetical protein